MSLVPSLLQAIVRVDGDALVMHAGDKPYVVAPAGQVDLASRGLTLEAVNGIVSQLLPVELQHALEEFGAVQHELAAMAEFPGEHFTIVAARGGDDVWAEIRRRRIPEDDRVPDEFFASSHAVSSQPAASHAAPGLQLSAIAAVSVPDNDEVPIEILGFDSPAIGEPAAEVEEAAPLQQPEEVVELDDDLLLPDVGHLWPGHTAPAADQKTVAARTHAEVPHVDVDAEPQPMPLRPAAQVWTPPLSPPPVPAAIVAPQIRSVAPPAAPAATVAPSAPPAEAPPIAASVEPPAYARPAAASVETPADARPAAASVETPAYVPPAAAGVEVPAYARPAAASVETPAYAPPVAASVETPAYARPAAALAEPLADAPVAAASVEISPDTPTITAAIEAPYQAPPIAASVEPPQARAVPPPPAVVLNISRNPIRSEMPPPPVGDPTLSGLERLLRVSSARGASTLYLSSESRPSVRVDGELQMLDGEPVHVARDVESLLLTLMPERSHEALRTGAATEWICDLEGVGRVRCMSFRDQRGPGGVFRLMPTRSVSADQLGLPKQVQALAIEPEGIVLVAGPRSSGKRTTMSAFVELMNRTRRDHIITIEREINIQHERGQSFISQREVRGSDEDVLAAVRAAMREDPDVLVIEELRTGALMNVALEAAAAGRLVVGGFTAHTATGAIDRIIDLYAPEYHRQVQMALADSLRGVIAQVLLRKIGGGRLPAREVLLNTPAVSGVIAEGKTSQLPMAIEGGRRYGMMPLNDALVGLVKSGAVESREAYRQSPDRPGFLAALNRQGIDTSFVERLANG